MSPSNGKNRTFESPPEDANDDPHRYHDEFYRFSYHYGDKAARMHFGLWSPRIGCVNPYGRNPNGVMPHPEKGTDEVDYHDEIEWDEVDFHQVDRQIKDSAVVHRKGPKDRAGKVGTVDGAKFCPVAKEHPSYKVTSVSNQLSQGIHNGVKQCRKVVVETALDESDDDRKLPGVPQFLRAKPPRKGNPYMLERPLRGSVSNVARRQRPEVLVETVLEESGDDRKAHSKPARQGNLHMLEESSRGSVSNIAKKPHHVDSGRCKSNNDECSHLAPSKTEVYNRNLQLNQMGSQGRASLLGGRDVENRKNVSEPIVIDPPKVEKRKSLYQPLEFVCVSPDKKKGRRENGLNASGSPDNKSSRQEHLESVCGSHNSNSSSKSCVEKRGERVFLTGKNKGKSFKYVKLYLPEYALNSMGYCKSRKQTPWPDLDDYLKYLVDTDSQYKEDIIGFYQWVESHTHVVGDDTSTGSWSKEGTTPSPVKLLDDIEMRSHYDIMSTIFESPEDSAPMWFEIMNRTRFVISKKGVLSDESDFDKRVDLMRSCWVNLRRSIETNDLWHYNLFFKEMMYYVLCFHPGWMNKMLTKHHKMGFYAGEDPEDHEHGIL